ncbi:MAG: heme A synthase [Bacteroidia bacterium]|nr:heme A synthase [Bacteroidia bacterium]
MISHTSGRFSKPIAIWLLIGVGMIVIQVLLGGITRLTGSGLSITEWDIITGTLPPIKNEQWITEFEKYRQTPQFSYLNFDFTLSDFKFIYFWEWFHRLWARLIGVVFLVPFIVFVLQKRFKPEMIKPLVVLFLLGALQGVVGWIMVASGLEGDAIYVAPIRLALHLILALGLLCYTFWFALRLLVPDKEIISNRGLSKMIWLTLGLLIIQLFYGALMAGYKAATAAPTWPDINGTMLPGSMFGESGSLFENKITIHFIHRMLAYAILLAAIWISFHTKKINGFSLIRKTWWLPAFLVFIQVLLGIASVLTSLSIIPNQWGVFEWMAQAHQLFAMLLLLSLVWFLYLVNRNVK